MLIGLLFPYVVFVCGFDLHNSVERNEQVGWIFYVKNHCLESVLTFTMKHLYAIQPVAPPQQKRLRPQIPFTNSSSN